MLTVDELKSELALFSYILVAILPDTRKGKWTSFESIMMSNAIRNWEFTEDEVKQLLHKKVSAHIFANKDVGYKKEYCIDQNFFYTDEERAESNYTIHNLKKS
ncbi:hypothetical protein KA001_03355 [Patescibacteria group bacterium]|nr:hypothetical protein [Patescibacteria group bacterium]